MIEEIVLNYLKAELSSLNVPVYMEAPKKNSNPYSDPFVVIEKTGSEMTNWIFHATLAIQSYAPTLFEAASLNEKVKSAMFGILKLPEITKAELNGDYNYTNPTTKQPRYQAVFELTHYYINE